MLNCQCRLGFGIKYELLSLSIVCLQREDVLAFLKYEGTIIHTSTLKTLPNTILNHVTVHKEMYGNTKQNDFDTLIQRFGGKRNPAVYSHCIQHVTLYIELHHQEYFEKLNCHIVKIIL